MTQKCIKCKNFGHLSTCNGCQQSFCNEHLTEHREELSHKMASIDKEYRHFEENLNENDLIQSYLPRIDQWEHESINKIKKTAEIARNDLLKIFNRMKNQLKSTLDKTYSDIQTNRKLQNYTEINLNQWMEQLKQLRHIYTTSLTDDIIDDNQSSIQLIKIIDKNPSFTIEESRSFSREKFDKIVGAITLSKDRLTATCSGSHWNGSNISGTNLYSSGIHSIRFRITKKGKNNLFFGITSSLRETNPWNRKIPFAYGWWEIPIDNDKKETIFDDNEKKIPEDQFIKTDDEVTLTLDCLNNQIQFEHHRTNRYIDETITDEQCPLPWKLAIVLYSPGDSVRILST
jgi:hypothetical protein